MGSCPPSLEWNGFSFCFLLLLLPMSPLGIAARGMGFDWVGGDVMVIAANRGNVTAQCLISYLLHRLKVKRIQQSCWVRFYCRLQDSGAFGTCSMFMVCSSASRGSKCPFISSIVTFHSYLLGSMLCSVEYEPRQIKQRY